LFGFVAQNFDQLSDPPVPDALVMTPTGVRGQHSSRITDAQCAGPLPDGPLDDRFRRLVLGLADPPGVPGLDLALSRSMAPPPPGALLAGFGSAAGRRPASGFGISRVEVVLGPDRPSGHEQAGIRGGHGIGVDDPDVHAGDPAGDGLW
jgi:hypothetical protein